MTTKEKRVSVSSDSGSDSSSGDEKENNKPSNDLVVTKYNMAAEIVNTVLKVLIFSAVARRLFYIRFATVIMAYFRKWLPK